MILRYASSSIKRVLGSVISNLNTDGFAVATAVAGVIQAGGAFFSLLISMLLARMLGATGLGMYAPIVALSTILAAIASAGVPISVVKLLPGALARGDTRAANGIVHWAYAQVACNCFIFIALLVLASSVSSALRNSGPYIALLMSSTVFLMVNRGILQGLGKTHISQLSELCVKNGSFCAVLVVSWLITRHSAAPVKPFDALLALSLSSIVALTVGSVYIFKSRRLISSAARAQYAWRRWTADSLRIMVANLSGFAVAGMGLLLLPLLVTHEQVGIYRAAQSMAAVLGIPLVAANIVLGPRISRSYALDNYLSLKRMLTFSARFTTAISCVIAVLFLVFGRTLLQIVYGDEFAGSYSTLMIMIAGQITSAACGSVIWVLQIAGHQRTLIRATFIGLVLQFLAILCLSKYFAANGAAAGDVIAIIGINIYFVIHSWSALRVDPSVIGRFNGRNNGNCTSCAIRNE